MIQMSILQPTQQAALGIGVELIHAIELILPTNTSRWNSQKNTRTDGCEMWHQLVTKGIPMKQCKYV